MTVYHGSNKIIKVPDIAFSKKFLDFGVGFYVTTYSNQAENWALRKSKRYGGAPTVSLFELSENLENYKVLDFKNTDEDWLDFVAECRKGSDKNKDYDIIIGNVADDDVFKTVSMYFQGLWDKERTIKELRYYKVNNQICIVKQKVLEDVLSFKSSYEVKQ